MAGGIPRFGSGGYLPPLCATVLAKTIKLNQRRACDFLSVSYQQQYQKYARVCIVLGICIYYDGVIIRFLRAITAMQRFFQMVLVF